MKARMHWIWLAAALLGACSVPSRRDAPVSPEAYLKYAGAPIQRFSYRDSDYRWQSASAARSTIAACSRTRHSRAAERAAIAAAASSRRRCLF